jgi:hypothetical protein
MLLRNSTDAHTAFLAAEEATFSATAQDAAVHKRIVSQSVQTRNSVFPPPALTIPLFSDGGVPPLLLRPSSKVRGQGQGSSADRRSSFERQGSASASGGHHYCYSDKLELALQQVASASAAAAAAAAASLEQHNRQSSASAAASGVQGISAVRPATQGSAPLPYLHPHYHQNDHAGVSSELAKAASALRAQQIERDEAMAQVQPFTVDGVDELPLPESARGGKGHRKHRSVGQLALPPTLAPLSGGSGTGSARSASKRSRKRSSTSKKDKDKERGGRGRERERGERGGGGGGGGAGGAAGMATVTATGSHRSSSTTRRGHTPDVDDFFAQARAQLALHKQQGDAQQQQQQHQRAASIPASAVLPRSSETHSLQVQKPLAL